MKYFIGVDVGTKSVRAALVQTDGKIVSTATQEIQIWTPAPDMYEQSSDDIWNAVITTVKSVVAKAGVGKTEVAGIGFDATCSLVVLDTKGRSLSVSPSGRPECNVVMWMDHRASKEADEINTTGHDVLRYIGGVISIEMEPPKLMWLKRNLRESCWDKAGSFMDLCDFLTWRATGSETRSLCSMVAKWTYVVDNEGKGGIIEEFYQKIGLEDLLGDNLRKIGTDVQPQGVPCGEGLSATAASELGLSQGMPVSVGIIDAHAGSIACLGCQPGDSSIQVPPLNQRMAMICGTSTCHMATNETALFVPGVWGPFFSSVVPGLWTAEGGQSAAGKLIDFVVENHSAYGELLALSDSKGKHIHDCLCDILKREAEVQSSGQSMSQLTRELHIWPDFHGNRAPLADHTLKGMVCGLTLRSGLTDLALLYLATVQALAYGTRHILSEMYKVGYSTSIIYMCGGLRKNQLYVQTHADVTGLSVVVPDEEESVLLGAAVLGATASGHFPSIKDAMDVMCGKGEVVSPNKQDESYHAKKYEVFLQMYKDQRKYKEIMNS